MDDSVRVTPAVGKMWNVEWKLRIGAVEQWVKWAKVYERSGAGTFATC